jgi:hypothetical protein
MANTISISIDLGDGSAPKRVTGIPWFPGITVLQAMVLGQAMNPGSFSFRIVYHSFFGAFVDMIDDTPDQGGEFWLFSIENQSSSVGVSEAIILEDQSGEDIEVEWLFTVPDQHPAKRQIAAKLKAYEKK